MIRIRFHGRGGHGIKTASRIVGTAAFMSGLQTQDSPIYGAERRGAAIAAFTRIDTQPILERGVITQPNLIVVGDETLLDDPAAGVLSGEEYARMVFINISQLAALSDQQRPQADAVALDVSSITADKLGKASTLSASLAAASARLIGVISLEHLLQATDEECRHAGLQAGEIEKNLAIAAEVYDKLKPVQGIGAARRQPAATGDVVAVSYDSPVLGTPSILAAGNSNERQTGTWRVERPEIDYDICTRCGICFVRCPDSAITLDEAGYPVIEYEHCKGCMECWDQCPVKGAIHKEKEVRAW